MNMQLQSKLVQMAPFSGICKCIDPGTKVILAYLFEFFHLISVNPYSFKIYKANKNIPQT